MKINTFNIADFESLPEGLKDSDYVDLLLFLINQKPGVRLGKSSLELQNQMKNWAKKRNFGFIVNYDNYVYLGKTKLIARMIQLIDDSYFSHEFLLGRFLGYPTCCCKKVKFIGEKNIDLWENELCNTSIFKGKFRLINPSGYTQGKSLISHIPCSCNCEKSLTIAKKALSIIIQNKENEKFSRWKEWF